MNQKRKKIQYNDGTHEWVNTDQPMSRIDEIKKRLLKATKGEWVFDGHTGIWSTEHNYIEKDYYFTDIKAENGFVKCNEFANVTWGNFKENAEFIANSKSDIEYLLEIYNSTLEREINAILEVSALRRRIEKLETPTEEIK